MQLAGAGAQITSGGPARKLAQGKYPHDSRAEIYEPIVEQPFRRTVP